MKYIDLDLIKKLRINARMSQEEMAKKVDMSLYQYHRKETGKQPFEALELKKVADIHRVNMDIFFKTDLQKMQLKEGVPS